MPYGRGFGRILVLAVWLGFREFDFCRKTSIAWGRLFATAVKLLSVPLVVLTRRRFHHSGRGAAASVTARGYANEAVTDEEKDAPSI